MFAYCLERACCLGACGRRWCFLSTSLCTSWNLASSMSQTRKLTPKVQIHVKMLAFWRAFSPCIDNDSHKQNQAPRNRPLNQTQAFDHLCNQTPTRHSHLLISVLHFLPCPFPVIHPKNLMLPVKSSWPSVQYLPHQQALTVSLTYMVESLAALTPAVKQSPLWEAVECSLSKV